MIPKETVEHIIETARIEEVVGDFVALKKSGSNYKGLSPFANEKTPSFVVSPSKNIFKCFSSGKGGNSVSFLMEVEHLSFPEALRWLADKYNIEIEEEEQSPEEIQEQNKRESLLLVTKFAKDFFVDSIQNSDEGKAIGLSYFKERGFREDIIHKFELGYNPDSWNALYNKAKEAGHNIDFLAETGLLKKKDDGNYFDFFKGRVIFPIHNLTGRVIAFGARTLKNDKKIAKYFNSPESEIYHKSNVLYGIYQAKQRIVKDDVCYLVEGYTDVISLYQSGIENVVASSGTSLTEGQIKLIQRYTKNITILYDGDAAGIKASFRGIDMILKAGMNVKVVLFPDGEDPDSFAKKSTTEELNNYISEHSEDFLVFKSNVLLEDSKKDPLKKAETIKEIVQSISLIPDSITREVYIKECSNLFDLDELTLHNEVNNNISGQTKAQQKKQQKQSLAPPPNMEEMPLEAFLPPEELAKVQQQSKPQVSPSYHQEKGLIEALIAYGEQHIEITTINDQDEETKIDIPIAWYVIHELEEDEIEFKTPLFQNIYEIYLEHYNAEEPSFPKMSTFTNHLDNDIRQFTVDVLSSPYELSENWKKHYIFTTTAEMQLEKHLNYLILNFKLKRLQEMISTIEEQLKRKDNSLEIVNNLLEQKIQLDNARKHFSSLLGIVIGV